MRTRNNVRIAQIAPLTESIPPRLHGGKARAISYLTEELCDLGHQVTLFASGDSLTRAKLHAGSSVALGPVLAGAREVEVAEAHREMLHALYAQRERFDVIHFHLDDWHLLYPPLLETCHLTSVHAPLHGSDVALRTRLNHRGLRLMSVSEHQREALPRAHWLGSVHHGLPDGFCRPCFEPGRYLVFVGRVGPERGVEQAVTIARAFGLPLKIAGRVERADHAFFRALQASFRANGVEYLGELDELRKDELLAGAYALLQPGQIPESFALPVIEAMQCGTPVVGLRSSGVAELIEEAVTGFVVNDVSAATAALHRVPQLDRNYVACSARHRFSARRMARDYLRWYARSIAREPSVSSSIAHETNDGHAFAEPGE
ncbi:MAG: glycosyltransferase family 4 protein [Myxococcales bacterium]